MSSERIKELINLIQVDRSIIENLKYEELDELNKYLLNNNIENLIAIIDEGVNDIDD